MTVNSKILLLTLVASGAFIGTIVGASITLDHLLISPDVLVNHQQELGTIALIIADEINPCACLCQCGCALGQPDAGQMSKAPKYLHPVPVEELLDE